MSSEAKVATIRTLLDQQLFAVLATSSQGAPYTSLVAYRVSEDLQHLFLTTNRATRKFANLSADARVSLLVDNARNRPADLVEAAAVTVLGTISELHGAARDAALEPYLLRHPQLGDFAKAPTCALLAVRVSKYLLVDRFQQLFEYLPGATGPASAGEEI